jgi:hypothetical protein
MKVIVFFGHHKVGSTALQGFLAANYFALLKAGILYPAVEAEGLVHTLANALDGQKPRLAHEMNLREPHNALAFRMLASISKTKTPDWHGQLPGVVQMIRTIRLQIDTLRPQAVILCSEVMSNFGAARPKFISDLRDIFPGATFELYCVLRRPDDYLVSWHGQRLRFGEAILPLSGGAVPRYYPQIHFDYRKLVAPWLKVFADSPVHLRTYGEVVAAGGIEPDFMATVEAPFPRGLKTFKEANVSLPRAAMEIVRQANHALPGPEAEALRNYFLSASNGLRPVASKDVEMFGSALRTELCDRFDPIHAFLSETTGKAAFFPDIDDMRSPRPIAEAEATAQLLAQIRPGTLPGEASRDLVRRMQEAVS